MQKRQLVRRLCTFYVRFENEHTPLSREPKMSAFDTTHTAQAARIGSIFTAALGALSSWNDARMTRRSLAALTDRELDDIGLCRGDIDHLTRRF